MGNRVVADRRVVDTDDLDIVRNPESVGLECLNRRKGDGIGGRDDGVPVEFSVDGLDNIPNQDFLPIELDIPIMRGRKRKTGLLQSGFEACEPHFRFVIGAGDKQGSLAAAIQQVFGCAVSDADLIETDIWDGIGNRLCIDGYDGNLYGRENFGKGRISGAWG